MASAFSHAIAGVAIAEISRVLLFPGKELKRDLRFWVIAAVCAALPDLDAIGYWLNVPYESIWGHRGITHSLAFAALMGIIVCHFFYGNEKTGGKKWWSLFVIFFAVTASHGVLDAMTTGGLGVGFFIPFKAERYFFDFRPIQVSPISITRFFSEKGVRVLKSEFAWVWIPSFVVLAVASLIRKLRTT